MKLEPSWSLLSAQLKEKKGGKKSKKKGGREKAESKSQDCCVF